MELSAKISSFKIADGKTTFVLFDITVKAKGRSWIIRRRFSEFVALRKELVKKCKDLPSLPKTWLPVVDPSDKAFVEQRRLKLNGFLRGCTANDAICRSSEFLRFLVIVQSLESGLTEEKQFRCSFLGEFQSILDPLFGVNDFILDRDHRTIMSISQDVFVVSRIDSFLSNIQMPWQKESDSVVPVGTLNLWSYQQTAPNQDQPEILLHTEEKGEWVPVCTLYFEVAVTAMVYGADHRTLTIGLDDGRLYIYSVSDHTFKVKKECHQHEDRVTGLVYDKSQTMIISCSKDKTLKAYDLSSKEVTAVQQCESSLQCMAVDRALNQILVGCADGSILIFKFDPTRSRDQQLTRVHSMSRHTGPVTCLFFDETERYLFSGSQDNTVGIFQIEAQTENVSRSRTVGCLRAAADLKSVRSLFYNRSSRQICSGHSQGSMVIWQVGSEGGQQLYRLDGTHKYAVTSMLFEAEVGCVVSSGEDGKIRRWNFSQ